jgi:hypothetical protein
MTNTIANLRQAPQSGDCGYFAGYVLWLRHQYGALCSTKPVTVRDAYHARNTYWWRKANKPKNKPASSYGYAHSATGQGINVTADMLTYIRGLGVMGYVPVAANNGTGLQSDSGLSQLLQRHSLPLNSKKALLLGINHPSRGHWLLVIARYPLVHGRSKQNMYVVYDPALRSRPTMGMLTEASLIQQLGIGGVFYYFYQP